LANFLASAGFKKNIGSGNYVFTPIPVLEPLECKSFYKYLLYFPELYSQTILVAPDQRKYGEIPATVLLWQLLQRVFFK